MHNLQNNKKCVNVERFAGKISFDKPLAFEVIEDHQRPASQARGLSEDIFTSKLYVSSHFS